MFIKSIVIDGFKSYAKRTEITGFDPAFNAITGLNGSGKSNILDAICFLLGITNLSQVRANTLQDLIYKGGQAGVVKATVSIVFDNRQKAVSPIGYETYDELTITRQIVMGGKNKYLINGNNVPNNRVHDLLRSVQLNVNNPHFLIMQGRITKVLNMKPPEILSLLEEAAATKLYETKRESTLATIDKKESKLKEIEQLLREEINPKLTKLRLERDSYMEYQNVVREIDYLKKFIVACRYINLKEIVDNAGGQLCLLTNQKSKEENAIIKCNEERRLLEKDVSLMSERRSNDLLPKYEQLDANFSELEKQGALIKNSIKRSTDTLKAVRENLKKLDKEKSSEEDSANKIKRKIEKIQSQYDKLQKTMNDDKIRLEKAHQKLQEVNSGLFTDESGAETVSLSEMLSSAINVESNLETELKILKMKITHHENVAKNLEKEICSLDRDDSVDQQKSKYAEMKSRIVGLDQSIAKSRYDPNMYNLLSEKLTNNKATIWNNEKDKEKLLFNHQWLNFEYTKPHPSFDDTKIKGVVASLLTVENKEFYTALTTAAGSRLYNVIVEDDEVAAVLLKNNCLKERKTFLPLNKMRGDTVPDHVLRKAQNMVGIDNVWSVMSLVKFDEKYRQAMNYVFGHCLIARNLDIAKIIAFNREIGVRAVTLDGDVFDPEGTLVGGVNENRDIFGAANFHKHVNNTLKTLYEEQRTIEGDMKNVQDMENKWKQLSHEREDLDIKMRQLHLKMMQNNYLQVEKDLCDANEELKKLNAEFLANKSLHDQAKLKTKEARENVENSASIKEKAQKAAENDVKLYKKQCEKSENEFNSIEVEYDTLVMELNSNNDDGKLIERNINEIKEDIKVKEEAVSDLEESLNKHNEIVVSAEEELKKQNKCLAIIDEDINKKKVDIKKVLERKEKAESDLEDVNHKIEMHHVDSAAAEEKLTKIIQKNEWINEERDNFGKPGSIYDFKAHNMRSAEQKMEKLNEQKQKLSRKVDMRGMNMLGQMESRYKEVTERYKQVLQDKAKLQDVIDDLDKRKDEVLKKAQEQVDQDFDKIFSTLLPGSRARLTPPQGKTLKDGLEFRIAFGNVWKESLTELSGGQRSLVALSLILALLKFKPAPLYILDEVDAALDISHTQNIGTIIKEQFSNSQFIIVSLKDGMFNNANVLYKTKFVDGVSTVSRHLNQARRPMTEKNN